MVVPIVAPQAFTDGEIASCTFTIDPAAPVGTHVIQAERAVASDEEGNGFDANAVSVR
jgi:hypothetical protein